MKMKKRNKLHLLAFMLVAALMMTVATPTVSARADDDLQETPSTNCDLLDNGIGDGYGCKSVLSTRGRGNVHGNSLANTATNYGYALVDNNTSHILKFGETLYPQTRYSQKYLDTNNATMKILESGSKASIHMWQYDMNSYYRYKYGIFPPLNKRGW